jgi:hypothetical protein
MRFFPLGFLFLISNTSFAQITFQKSYNAGGNDIQQTSDGGYILLGTIGSGIATDIYLVKTNEGGDTIWTRSYGGLQADIGNTVRQTSDQGYLVFGTTYSFGTDSGDVYVIRTDLNADMLWSKTYGSVHQEYCTSGKLCADNGFVVTGYSGLYGPYNMDIFLIRADLLGNVSWTIMHDIILSDFAHYVGQTADHGFIITSEASDGTNKVFIMKVDSMGNTNLCATYDVAGYIYDSGHFIQQTSDGGFLITGQSAGWGYVLVIKTDPSGNVIGSRIINNGADDHGYSAREVADGYIVAGYANSYPPAAPSYQFLMKIDLAGSVLWHNRYGTGGAYAVDLTDDGGYVFIGSGMTVVKTDSLGYSGCNQSSLMPYAIVTNPAISVNYLVPSVNSVSIGVSNASTTQENYGGTVTTFCSSVGLPPEDDHTNDFIKLYPNPVGRNFKIVFPELIKNGGVCIYNTYGAGVFSTFIVNETEKDIRFVNVPGGIYIVEISTPNRDYHQKIVVESD